MQAYNEQRSDCLGSLCSSLPPTVAAVEVQLIYRWPPHSHIQKKNSPRMTLPTSECIRFCGPRQSIQHTCTTANYFQLSDRLVVLFFRSIKLVCTERPARYKLRAHAGNSRSRAVRCRCAGHWQRAAGFGSYQCACQNYGTHLWAHLARSTKHTACNWSFDAAARAQISARSRQMAVAIRVERARAQIIH